MSANKRLAIRLDATSEIGLGHAVRTSALLEALAELFALDVFIIGDSQEYLKKYFPGTEVIGLNGQDLARILNSLNPDAVLSDLPHHTPELWKTLKHPGRPLIAIDDEGGDVRADLVINGSVPASSHHYPTLLDGGHALTGPAYTLLRNAFSQHRWKAENKRSVCVVIGSGSRAQEWAFNILEYQFDKSRWGEITLVVGSAFADVERLSTLCQAQVIALHQGVGAGDLAKHLASARVALVTGGMVSCEALAVGVPSLVFPQVTNLIPEVAWLAERGAVIDLGHECGMDFNIIDRHISEVLRSSDLARSLSIKGLAIIDGHGAKRAAEVISRLI